MIRFSTDQLNNLLRTGKINPILNCSATDDVQEKEGVEDVLELAKTQLGEDFLGEEKITVMEDKCHTAGIDVEFELPDLNFQYTLDDLEVAGKTPTVGYNMMSTLRPLGMKVNGMREAITINNLIKLFKDINPFGDGVIFNNEQLLQKVYLLQGADMFEYSNADYSFNHTLKSGYAMVTQEILPTSPQMLSWSDLEQYVTEDYSRREAVETVWDLILYYANTGKRLLPKYYDATKTIGLPSMSNTIRTNPDHIGVGKFDEKGISFRYIEACVIGSEFGTCLYWIPIK